METFIPDRWHSFECYGDHGSSGLVFDIRLADTDANNIAVVSCPVCGRLCDRKSSWLADDHGFGSSADYAVPMLSDAARQEILSDPIIQYTIETGSTAEILLFIETAIRNWVGRPTRATKLEER